MYSKYSNPQQVLGQFSTLEVGLYIDYIATEELKQAQDDYLFDVWLHKVWDAIDYKDWKRSILKRAHTQRKKLTDTQAQANIKRANAILGIKEVSK